MERYDWREFAEAIEVVYGGEVDYEEGYARCPECDEPILKCDWPKHNFNTCPVCEWNIEVDMNGGDSWEELEELEELEIEEDDEDEEEENDLEDFLWGDFGMKDLDAEEEDE